MLSRYKIIYKIELGTLNCVSQEREECLFFTAEFPECIVDIFIW